MKNIVLIGMPGCGKSTIGVLLAKALGMRFVDTDLIIQDRQKRLLQDIINNDGIERFLCLEEETLLSLEFTNAVIATGGSAVYSSNAMKRFKEDSVIVYLELDLVEIQHRVNNIKSRGIVMRKDKTLGDIYEERVPLYKKYSDITNNCNGKSIEQIVEELTLLVQANYCAYR